LKIVGIVEPILPEIPEANDFDALHQFAFMKSTVQHRLYVPNIVAEMMFHISEQGDYPLNLFIYNFFLLNDPMDFEAFALEVENLPNGPWRAFDFSAGFSIISTSMISIQEMADLVLLMAIGATLLIISLVLLFFLRERKHEVGIYLALGEQKKNIVFQMLLELLPIIMLGMTIALFIGSVLAGGLSQEMLRQTLEQEAGGFLQSQELHQLEHFGYRFELTSAEMLENYEVRIEPMSVGLFYVLGLGATAIAIIIPIIFVVNTNPKKLLSVK